MGEKFLRKANCRDLAYLRRPDGTKLREGLFFRSASLFKAKPQFLAYIKEHNIQTIIDLRTDVEIEKKPDVAIEGVRYLHIPILKAETIGITHGKGLKGFTKPPNMPALYASLVSAPESKEGLKQALSVIFDPQRKGAILWHCTAGKDRAGLLTALFLLALGYQEEEIYADYELSDAPSKKKGRLYANLIRFLMWKPRLAKAVYLAMRAKREYLKSAITEMKRQAGSIAAYLKSLGVARDQVASLFPIAGV